jgi:hypothetical protein
MEDDENSLNIEIFLVLQFHISAIRESSHVMMIFIQVSPTNSIDYLPYNSIQHAVTEGMNHITSMTKSTLMPHIARYNNFNCILNSK